MRPPIGGLAVVETFDAALGRIGCFFEADPRCALSEGMIASDPKAIADFIVANAPQVIR
jgi:hypothetical protein